jgi:hypothetical protein
LNPRPSGYEPDELPGCSTPRSKDGQYTAVPRSCKRYFRKLSCEKLKESLTALVYVLNTEPDETTQAHSSKFPGRTRLDAAISERPTSLAAQQEAVAAPKTADGQWPFPVTESISLRGLALSLDRAVARVPYGPKRLICAPNTLYMTLRKTYVHPD